MTKVRKVILPELGEGIEQATIARWHFRVGDNVHVEDDLVELVADKASFNVPSGASGVIQNILVPEGRDARVGEVLALVAVI